MVIERENLLDENGLPKKPMRLVELPFLMKQRAINFMNTAEKIRLAALSENMEKNIKAVKAGIIPYYNLRLTDNAASVSLDQETVEVAVTDDFPAGNLAGEKVPKREIEKWCDDKKESTENLIIVLNKLRDLFCDPNRSMLLGLKLNVAERNIQKMLNLPVFRTVQKLEFENFRLEKNTIDMIMELMDEKLVIDFHNLKFPRDYYHEKALKCSNIYYTDGWWISVAQLLTMKHLMSVNLYSTSLDSVEILMLLKFWQNVDYDMFEDFYVNTRECLEDLDDFDEVLEVVGYSEIEDMFRGGDVGKFYIMISRAKSANKLRQMAFIRIREESFQILAKPAKQFTQYIEIMDLINLKSAKEDAISYLADEAQMREWTGEDVDVGEDMRQLTAEKEQLERRLMTLNVEFVGRKARLVREQPAVVEVVEEVIEDVDGGII